MSIQMTGGRTLTMGDGSPVVLYDTVDGMAFGPTFEDRAEAEAFLRWWPKKYVAAGFDRLFAYGGVKADVRILKDGGYGLAKQVADDWRALLEEHKPSECPYDGDDTEGFLSDRDSAVDGQAWTPQCSCECHDRAVRYAEEASR